MNLQKVGAVILLAAVAVCADVSPQRYLENVKSLASDRFKGRGNDLPELQEAAKFVAGKFRACGLQPLKGSFFHKFKATTGGSAGPNNTLTVQSPTGPKPFRSASDFVPLGISDSGKAGTQVIFAGYGITAPEFNYDDYANLDVKGKIVLVLRHEPQEQDEKSVFLGKEFTRYAGIVEKAINAKFHGAAAMVLVNDPNPHNGEPDDLVKLETLMGPETLGIPAIHVKREVADAMLAGSGATLKDLQSAIDADLKSHSTVLPAKAEMTVDVTRRVREIDNVIGILPGSDPELSKEYVVIGAHYDHLGLGDRHSLAPSQIGKIHYGADDNASGTAGVIELACDLAPRRKELKRSFVFMAFAGEELGLLGSRYYTTHPELPLEKTAAMLNLDMIGRPKDRKVYVGGIGSAQEFRNLVEDENKPVKLNIEFSSFGADASDHTSFNVAQVPALFFFSGLHSDYHKPSDTWDKINAADAADVLRLVERVALRLDVQPQKPLFVRVAAPAHASGGSVTGGTGGYGAWFGSVPDFGEIEKGVKFADVREGSPAAQAGLKAGDILIEFDGKNVANLQEFTFLLRSHKPGDEVDVVVLRGKERVPAKVKLGRRPG